MPHPFIHLRVHSEYSLVDGLLRLDDMVNQALTFKMPALALTDWANLFGVVKFYKAAQAKGLKPIIGADLWLANPKTPNQPFNVLVLCQNQQGYHHLIQLLSQAYVEGQYEGKAQIKTAWLERFSEGLILLSGASKGPLGQALLGGDLETAEEWMRWAKHYFKNRLYLEIQRTGRPDEDRYIEGLLPLAASHHLPLVATNDVHFLKQEDYIAHEARVCIHQGYTLADHRRPQLYSPQQYFTSPQEMWQRFIDLPSALTNTFEIAKRCTVTLNLGQVCLPDFPVPAEFNTNTYFEFLSQEGLEKRLALCFSDSSIDELTEKRIPYDQRLALEIGVIKQMGFAGYFLIVADFIGWARDNDIPVGPGRGSGAGSLVAYALGITDIDPLTYDLLFERFLNPERVSMPDFDIDFCMDGRDRVIDYVAQHYGRQAVSQIITYGTMAAKAVIRDVGRVQGHPYGFVDKLAKLIPLELGITLEKALQDEPLLLARYQQEEEVKELIDLALKLEGMTRNAGKHAGGVVIAPTKLTDFCPLFCEPGSDHYVTQFDKDDVEAVGLVKFDFLGLRTLTIIHAALKWVNHFRALKGESLIAMGRVSVEDSSTYELLKRCETTAVFQLESRGMKDLIKRLQPDCFEEIIALVALFRPGPLQSGMVDDFIDRKHGRAPVIYPHPDLEPILKPTYGVILYQEQVMQIAQILAGYSLGAADLLRRAMGKKKPEEMAKQRDIFVSGAIGRGVDAQLASDIFDLMEKFAGYGFNKSHSAAYALVAYHTAWLKTHYPAAFMAAVLSSDMDKTEKVVIFVQETTAMGLRLLPPDINRSGYRFSLENESTIRYGLGAIKGVGEAVILLIEAAREEGGPFRDLLDFCRRMDLRKVNKRVLEALIAAGAMDCFGFTRATLKANLQATVQSAEKFLHNSQLGQGDLFGMGSLDDGSSLPLLSTVSDLPVQRLQAEKEVLGLYFSGHPIHYYQAELEAFGTTRISHLVPKPGSVWISGFIMGQRFLTTKRGDKMAFITLDDQSGMMDAAIFSDVLQGVRDLLGSDDLLLIEGEVSVDDFNGGLRMTVRQIKNLESVRIAYAKSLHLDLRAEAITLDKIEALKKVLEHYKDDKGINFIVVYQNDSHRCEVNLPQTFLPSDDCLQALYEIFGHEGWRWEYFR